MALRIFVCPARMRTQCTALSASPVTSLRSLVLPGSFSCRNPRPISWLKYIFVRHSHGPGLKTAGAGPGSVALQRSETVRKMRAEFPH